MIQVGPKIPSQMLLFEVEGCNTEEQRVEKYGRERHEIRGIDLSNDATNQGMPKQLPGNESDSSRSLWRERGHADI